MKWLIAVAVTLLILAGPAAASGPTYWKANLNGSNSGNASPALGAAFLTIDATWTHIVAYVLSYDGNLEGTTTASHLHRGAQGVNGPIVITLASQQFNSPYTAGPVAFTPADSTDMKAGSMYVDIHTTQFPNEPGEIRGQLIQVPTPADNTSWGRIRSLFR